MKDEVVFAADERRSAGSLNDSGATSHMTSHRCDLFDYEAMDVGPEFIIEDGKKIQVSGKGMVKLADLNGLKARW